jgi:hypothetical protein
MAELRFAKIVIVTTAESISEPIVTSSNTLKANELGATEIRSASGLTLRSKGRSRLGV